MLRTGRGYNILVSERGATIYTEEERALRGESVTLRPPRASDVEAVYSWDRDPELAAWNGRSPISVSLSAARRDYLARWEDPGVKTFIIEAAGDPIGMATLYDFRQDGCELGIKIGPGNLRGRGYASEAVTLLLDYVFETLGLGAVRGSTLAHNDRMQRVFGTQGFAQSETDPTDRYDTAFTELFTHRPRRKVIPRSSCRPCIVIARCGAVKRCRVALTSYNKADEDAIGTERQKQGRDERGADHGKPGPCVRRRDPP